MDLYNFNEQYYLVRESDNTKLPVILESIDSEYLGPTHIKLCVPDFYYCKPSHKTPTINSKIPKIKDVIFNDPATIVIWDDGSKTVVKAQDEGYDHEKGLAMAICKKVLGNSGKYYNEFKKWFEEDHKREVKKSKGGNK